MQPVTFSWIGLSAAAPLIFLVCAWVLGVYHSFRKFWRSVDLFLIAIFAQELLTALQTFIYALLSLMKPSSGIICSVFIWSISATRALQAATVTSLLVDRALTSQWPYKYRFSVRRHQIRYHLVVLATMAALVGVAAILARPSELFTNFEDCRFLPHSLHVRLALFLLSLYGILFVIAAVSACVVQTSRTCKGGAFVQDLTPITHGTTSSSTTTASSVRTHQLTSSSSTASSTSSARLAEGIHSSTTDLISNQRYVPHRGITKKPLHRSPLDDFRWGTSIAVASLCFIINHIPFMCLLVVGTFMPFLLPSWPLENLSLWLSLIEGLVLPLVLGLCDRTFSNAVVISCSKRQPPVYRRTEKPFRPVKDDVKAFPLTNGSLFSSLHMMTEEGTPPFHLLKSHVPPMRMGVDGDFRQYSPTRMRDHFGTLFFNSDAPSSMGYLQSSNQDPIYADPLNKACSLDSSLKDDHIYATLSETFGSYSSMSSDSGDHLRCSSATTVANDDFEYHGPKNNLREPSLPSYKQCDIVRVCHPVPQPPSTNLRINDTSSPEPSFRSSTSSDLSDFSHQDPKINHSRNACQIIQIPSQKAHPTFEEFENVKEFPPEEHKKLSEKRMLNASFHEEPLSSSENISFGLSKNHRNSSLSMNDLDRFDANELDQEEEMMFILPVKSESMLSLYKLYLAEDEESGGKSLRYSVEVSKSEGNLVNQTTQEGKGRNLSRRESAESEKYQKKKHPVSASSKIRRQHKIQRAKGNIYRAKHALSTHKENPREDSPEPTKDLSQDVISEGLKMMVVDRNKKKNGIITIKDPSVLSVEELFNVLGRASKSKNHQNSFPGERETSANYTQHNSEFKKIFVSEYI